MRSNSESTAIRSKRGDARDIAVIDVPDPFLSPIPQAPRTPRVSPGWYVITHLLLIPLVIGAVALLMERGALDMWVTRRFVDPQTLQFAWRDSLVLEILGHQVARSLPVFVGGIAFFAGLAGFVVTPLRPWRFILVAVGVAMLLGPVAVNLLKEETSQHCPSTMDVFGGIVDYAKEQRGPFWASGTRTAGRCLPSGHAAGGYALLALYFAGWAAGRPRWRWRGLAIGIGAGIVFSVVRLAQGAHFASATIWSAGVTWMACALVFLPLVCRRPTLPR